MKRDMNLIRRILNKKYYGSDDTFDDVSQVELDYHYNLCIDAGYMSESINITVDGRKFVEFFESNDVWNRVFARLKLHDMTSAPVDILKKLYTDELMKMLEEVNLPANETEIKPCPFCGWPGEIREEYGPNTVHCSNSKCGAHISHLSVLTGTAIEAWNRRV